VDLDDIILEDAMKKFGISREQAEQCIKDMMDDGLLQKNDDPSMPFTLKLTLDGNKKAEKLINEDFGEFRKVTSQNGIAYKVPTVVIMRGDINEDDLHHFPLWTDDD